MAICPLPFVCRRLTRGELAILVFFVVQALDAGLTYWGIARFGRSIEANPLLAHLMEAVGEGPALLSAKVVAASFGIVLHLTQVHRVVALLTLFYLCAAIVPWVWLLSS
jgi:hypothetical protein